jgi:hypothetical protein
MTSRQLMLRYSRTNTKSAPRRSGRMTRAEVSLSAHEEKLAAEEKPAKEARRTLLQEQAGAQRRIAALECKIGQQLLTSV